VPNAKSRHADAQCASQPSFQPPRRHSEHPVVPGTLPSNRMVSVGQGQLTLPATRQPKAESSPRFCALFLLAFLHDTTTDKNYPFQLFEAATGAFHAETMPLNHHTPQRKVLHLRKDTSSVLLDSPSRHRLPLWCGSRPVWSRLAPDKGRLGDFAHVPWRKLVLSSSPPPCLPSTCLAVYRLAPWQHQHKP